MKKFTNVIEELERYQKFTIGWDGYRSVTFDKNTVDKANKIVYLTQESLKTHFIHPDDISHHSPDSYMVLLI